MKWQTKNLDAGLAKKSYNWPPLVLIYGEDAGMTKYYANQIAKQVCPDMSDPFGSDRIQIEDLMQDPSRLADSANMVSFGGGVRLVKVDGVNKEVGVRGTNALKSAVEGALENLNEDAVIVIAAAGFDNKNATVKLVEKDAQAAAVRCYADTEANLGRVVTDFFKGEGKSVTSEAIGFLRENLGNDREVTLRELEKLLVYVGGAPEVTLADCLECVSSAPSISIFKLCDAIGTRDRVAADMYLMSLKEEGQDASMILTMVHRHLRRLMQAQSMMAQGMSADQAMMKLTPPVFFGKQEFSRQLRMYPAQRLSTLADRFYDLQLTSRNGLNITDLTVDRGILGFAF